MQLITIFICQFSMVLLLGLQSRFVRDSQYIMACGNSLLLGVCGLVIAPVIADKELLQTKLLLTIVYLSAGPIAISSAIFIHDLKCSKS